MTAIRRPSKEVTFQQEPEPRRVKVKCDVTLDGIFHINKLQGHFSVSTTSMKPADEVMQELLQVLGSKKINFKRKK